MVLESVTSFLLIFTAVRRDCHPADNTWAETFHHILHWCGGLHLFQLLQQRPHGWVHHAAGPTLRAASATDPHRDLQERLFPVECPSVTQWHCHQVGAATQLNLHTLAGGGATTIWAGIAWLRALDSCGNCLPSLACWWWHSLWPEHLLGSVYIQWLLFSWAGYWGGWRWKGWSVVGGVIVWQLRLCSQIVVSSTGGDERLAIWSYLGKKSWLAEAR